MYGLFFFTTFWRVAKEERNGQDVFSLFSLEGNGAGSKTQRLCLCIVESAEARER